MTNLTNQNNRFPPLSIIAVFLLSFGYWIYLAFTTQMIIEFDAFGFDQVGTLVYKSGWIEYFKTGPNREPLYPFLITLSKHIGAFFSLPYLYVQTAMQMGLLLATQIFTYRLLTKMNINVIISSCTLFYVGFSPALVKDMVAFANGAGGNLLIGVTDQGAIKNTKLTNDLKAKIIDVAKNCEPPIEINLETGQVGEDQLIIVQVSEGENKPYSCSSGFYLRHGASTQKMKRDEIVRFFGG